MAANGGIEDALVGEVKGWWDSSKRLTPSTVQDMFGRNKLGEALGKRRAADAAKRFGIKPDKVRRVLFCALKSPSDIHRRKAEDMLDKKGIQVRYIQDMVSELVAKLETTYNYGSSEILHVIRILKIIGKLK